MLKKNGRNNKIKLQILVSIASILVSTILATTKTAVALISGSMSILSSAIDSIFDVVNSVINFGAVKYAFKPADKEHKFGHYAIEDIAGLFQSSLIIVSALAIVLKSIDNLIKNNPVEACNLGIGVMILSLTLTILIVIFQSIVIRKAPSLTIESLSLHYTGDILTNTAIIGGLFYSKYFDHAVIIDSSLAIMISVYLIMKAIDIAKRSYNHLMDREVDDNVKKEIRSILRKNTDISGYHDIKTRSSGSKIFVQLHIEIDKDKTLEVTHDIADKIEKKIRKLADNIEVIIHQDPV